MSVNPDAGGMTYADHEVQHVVHENRFLSTADSGPSTFFASEEQFEITQRGLDPDELAELRAIRITADLRAQADGAQDSRGEITTQIGAGYNLSGDEFLSLNKATQDIDSDDSGTTDFQIRTRDTDEVGQLYTNRLSATVAFDDDANSNGGGAAAGASTSDMVNFADLTGGGPVVDAVDDFTSRVDLSVSNIITTVAAEVRYSLYYRVEESESGRTRFGR